MRVLLVEDHMDTARAMARLLQMNGHAVRTAGTLEGALAVAANEPFDWLITDVHLPDGCGLDLLPRLRDRAAPAGAAGALPSAIVVSGDDRDARPALEAGYVRHLVKPVRYDQLLALIDAPPPAAAP
jgi:DNA-binding response OmpR family regulator